MANGMMSPSNQDQQLMQQGIEQGMQKADAMMSEKDIMIQNQIEDSSIKLGGITKAATEGEATNFVISAEQFVSTIDDKVLDVLQTKLTPSMREALSVMLGPEVANILDEIGLQEPQHLVPQSVIAQAFPANTIEESLEMFDRQLMDQQNIPSPPQGGLGGAPIMDVPQTNVPPVV
tara:strand:- start:230 stop:757 length:528 start_codon:yes stop_codon:yes gene_type:complete